MRGLPFQSISFMPLHVCSSPVYHTAELLCRMVLGECIIGKASPIVCVHVHPTLLVHESAYSFKQRIRVQHLYMLISQNINISKITLTMETLLEICNNRFTCPEVAISPTIRGACKLLISMQAYIYMTGVLLCYFPRFPCTVSAPWYFGKGRMYGLDTWG
jgi:hypothetical protein